MRRSRTVPRVLAFFFEYRLNKNDLRFNVVGRFSSRGFSLTDLRLSVLYLAYSSPFIKIFLAKRGKTDGCWHSSTGVSPRPMLMGAAHNALWAFNARVSLTLPVCHRPQAATLALRSGAVRSPVTVVPSCGLETRSWRTGRMARHKQECIRLPYTAALASQRAFFVKVLPPATKERNRERVSCFRFQTGLVSSC